VPRADPPFLSDGIPLYLARRQRKRFSTRPAPWVEIGYAAMAIAVFLLVANLRFGASDEEPRYHLPASFEALLEREARTCPI